MRRDAKAKGAFPRNPMSNADRSKGEGVYVSKLPKSFFLVDDQGYNDIYLLRRNTTTEERKLSEGAARSVLLFQFLMGGSEDRCAKLKLLPYGNRPMRDT